MKRELTKTIICVLIGIAAIYGIGQLTMWLSARLSPIDGLTILPVKEGALPQAVNLKVEYPVIKKAAERNHCTGENFAILLAIRQAENGGPGREFGVLHPRAIDTNLDTQAGWSAATVVKNRHRWQRAGCPGEFIDFLADRYCPKECDLDGNKNWKRNVKYYARMPSKCG